MNNNNTTTTYAPPAAAGDPIVVIGAGGKTGRRVAARLEAQGRAVRGVSRSTTPAFDWYDQRTWPAALSGASAAYVTFQPDIGAPGADEIIAALTVAAERHGLQRLVLLSGRGEPQAQACEQIVLDGAVPASVVRCSLFAQSFSEDFLLDPVVDGVIALPAGDVAEPIVDAEDIADVAVACLTEDGHAGRVYELTGPRLLTFDQVASELSAVTGRSIAYEAVTPDEYAAGAIAAGVAEDEAHMLAELFAHIFAGHNATIAGGVSEALGRPPRDFRDYAVATAATGVWAAPAASTASGRR